MPFDPSRWMTQRRSHPRIGPAYQAPIPDCIRDVSHPPRVPAEWLTGPCGIPNGCAGKAGSADGRPGANRTAEGRETAAREQCAGDREEESQGRSARSAGLSSDDFVPAHASGQQRSGLRKNWDGAGVRTLHEAREHEGASGSGTLLTGGDIEAALGGGELAESEVVLEADDFAATGESTSRTVLTSGREHAQFAGWPGSSSRMSRRAFAAGESHVLDPHRHAQCTESPAAASVNTQINASSSSGAAACDQAEESVETRAAPEVLASASAGARRPEQSVGDDQPGGPAEGENACSLQDKERSAKMHASTAEHDAGTVLGAREIGFEGSGETNPSRAHADDQNSATASSALAEEHEAGKEGEREAKRPRLDRDGPEGEASA
ncbi:conserved hypothetical protein [Neospora caninum Liverpool]|uniref:Uncharacterized protein n=1 Tax=Neospora caninum (strain Liverpool) TaxID=572307 RepID=F0VFC0_NEOCL|nr:conserved hypothetical protein [Neospora caninum Liverpool]CBZ52414.1 conserved hypothetical protein [Neospora caninum Liverpool]CEL66386.1 TPA: hypothetical protein BN1204_022030 [Neospora caninum Liverpool]|eukprot:XP_003882446.1 conserved hypothetical protein [Neospora caninum Liverpool]